GNVGSCSRAGRTRGWGILRGFVQHDGMRTRIVRIAPSMKQAFLPRCNNLVFSWCISPIGAHQGAQST
ncbi:hypothetical protein SERLA73DRAFT_134476, partial [Serpula lacrymans var. lacrymans S7.3]